MTFEEEIEWVEGVFKEQQQICPMFVFYSENGIYTMPFEGRDFSGDEKMFFIEAATMIMFAFDCHAYSFMSEMWCRCVKKDDVNLDDIDPVVADKPDKIEGVFVLRKSRDIEKIHFFNIVRGEGKAYLKESDMGNGFDSTGTGTFSNIFPSKEMEAGISLENKKQMKAFFKSSGCLYEIERETE